jgi:hypothetical protein
LKRLWLIPLYVLALLVVPVTLNEYNKWQRRLGVAEAGVQALTIDNKRLTALADSLRRAERVRVDTFIKYKTLWDTLPPLIPALLAPDAKPVPAPVLASVIILGEKTVQACNAVVITCQQRAAVQDSIIANITFQRDYYRKQVPTFFDRTVEWGIRLGFFYLGTKVP